MSSRDTDPQKEPTQLQRALSRWDTEGGAGPCGPQEAATLIDQIPIPEIGPTELDTLHIRVIALENLVISLLATASDQQLDMAREMAYYISPRPGFTHHLLTTHAAARMIDLIERASRFRDGESS